MIILDNIKVPPVYGREEVERAVEKALRGSKRGRGRQKGAARPLRWVILRESIDARKHEDVHAKLRLGLAEESSEVLPEPLGINELFAGGKDEEIAGTSRPVVVGSGPCGLFAALALARGGRRPILVEQGEPVEERERSVHRYWTTGELDPYSNVQFGEGGAGTFSDGKLNTGTKSPWHRAVLEEFVLAGAPEEILYSSRPHIGTDILAGVVKRLRERIIALGGEVRFRTELVDILLAEGEKAGPAALSDPARPQLKGVILRETGDGRCSHDRTGDGGSGAGRNYELPCQDLILAPGHSSRKLVRRLAERGLRVEAKAFAVGVRIEHPQELIDKAQYGELALGRWPGLPASSYKLSTHLEERSVFSFCMCPGGVVVAAASGPEQVVTNGMSRYARASGMANSALLVNVLPRDTGGDKDPLNGFLFQEELEKRAWEAGGRSALAPAQLVGDLLEGRLSEPTKLKGASYRPGVVSADLKSILPAFVHQSIAEALPVFGRRISGFDHPEAILTAVESRSSSPVRLVRDPEELMSNVVGIRPAGEGAGYAGGIMSAAVDGLRVALKILER